MLLRSAIVACLTSAAVFCTPAGLSTGHGSVALDQTQIPLRIPPSVTVHEVPEGGKIKHVGDDIYVFDERGDLIDVAVSEREFIPSIPSRNLAQENVGAYAHWENPENLVINNYRASWEVPPVPTSLDGQILRYFASIDYKGFGVTTLRPQIQYGDLRWGGGDYWSACVAFSTGSHIYHTPLNKVAPGTTLENTIELLSVNDEMYTYVAGFAGWKGMHIEIDKRLDWVTSFAHEANSVHSRANWPSIPTVCSAVNVNTTQGKPEFIWATWRSSHFANITVDIQGAVDAQITVSYHD